jgi:signal peptidase I
MKNGKRYLGGAALAAVALAGWLLAGPSQLGGPVTYVAVTGTSMEPALHTGDLVIVRKVPEYQVGDVVAFRNTQLRSTVLHRIIAVEDGRFVLQGDNNDFVDTYRARPEDIVGRRWIVIGRAGKVIELVRTPVGAAVLLMVIAAIAMSGTGKRKKKKAGRATPGTGSVSWLHETRGPTMLVAGAAACAFALLGAFALIRPAQRTETAKVPYTESGRFTYEGRAESGPVYPTGRVATGQPIYLQLVDDLHFQFAYSLETSSPNEVAGSGSLDAVLSDGNGWSRRFALAPETEFEGTRWNVDGTLHLGAVRRLTNEVQKATGVFRDFYTLTVVPRIAVDGTIAERDFSTNFAPGLSFQVGALEMQVASEATASSATPAHGDALRPSQGGAVVAPYEVASSFSVLGVSLDVAKARIVGGAGTVLSLMLLALVGLMVRAPRKDEASLIDARYGRMIVPVDSVSPDPTASVVEVTEIESLVALARRYDRALLREKREDGAHRYVVENEGTIYSYTSVPPQEETTGSPSDTQELDDRRFLDRVRT